MFGSGRRWRRRVVAREACLAMVWAVRGRRPKPPTEGWPVRRGRGMCVCMVEWME